MADRALRTGLGALGVIAMAWGLRLLWVDRPYIMVGNFLTWLAGGVLLHDVILANVVLLAGALLSRLLPPRERGFVQAGLIVMALTGSVAFFVVWRAGESSSPSLALLQQDYLRNYAIVCAVVTAGTALTYSIRLVKDRKSRPE